MIQEYTNVWNRLLQYFMKEKKKKNWLWEQIVCWAFSFKVFVNGLQTTQPVITCSKLTIETLKQGMK